MSVAKKHAKLFQEFLMRSGVGKIAVGFMISTQITKFVDDFLQAAVHPFLEKLFPRHTDDAKHFKLKIGSVYIDITRLIIAFMRVLINLIIIYMIAITLSKYMNKVD
jgi:large-conductance mechanosensitive channel